MRLLHSSLALVGLASYAQAALIDFEDQMATGELTPIGQQYMASNNIVFGMVDVIPETPADSCSKQLGGACRFWFTEDPDPANPVTADQYARPLLVHIGGATTAGFVGPTFPDGTCGPNGTAANGLPGWYCAACCSNSNGGSPGGSFTRDVGFFSSNIGQRFITDQDGLSNPNTMKTFAIQYGALVPGQPGECLECGGSVLDVDCTNNAPIPQNPSSCEAWLIRGWDDDDTANAFLSDPNNVGWGGELDLKIISAQTQADWPASLDRRRCDPARTVATGGGGACPGAAYGTPTCCPEPSCGLRSAPWCALTQFGPLGLVDRSTGAAEAKDGGASLFSLTSGGAQTIRYITIEWAGTKPNNIGLAFDLFDTEAIITQVPTLPPGATPPPPTPTVTGSGGADPHFVGFSGGTFDVMGEANHVYNIISDSDFLLNARFVPGFTSHLTTYMGELGVRVGDATAVFDPASCTANVNDGLELPRAYGSYTLGPKSQIQMTREWIQLSTEHFLIDMHCVSKKASAHFDMRLRYLKGLDNSSRPHGILGQTTDGQFRSATGHQGEGAIEGVYTDYEVSDILAYDFVYNQFGVASASASRRLLAEGSEWLNARVES